MYVCMMKYGRKPQPLPIKPMGIIAYTFAFLGTTFVKIAGYTWEGERDCESNESYSYLCTSQFY